MAGSRLSLLLCAVMLGSVSAVHAVEVSPAAAQQLAARAKPDIIVVMVDDMGAIDQRVLSRLPNIRSIWLQGGLRFDAAFSETPLCCPGRAAFLTGQNTRHHGVTRNIGKLFNPTQSIATALDDAGYWTVMAGKYFNHSNEIPDKTPNGWDRVAMMTGYGLTTSTFYIQGVKREMGYKDRAIATQALSWLRAAPAASPVFMWITPHSPHKYKTLKPFQPSVEDKYKGDPRCANIQPWKPPNYAWKVRPDGFPLTRICRALLTTDEMVGALRAEAKAQGRNPYWVFMSDNGMAWGAQGYPLKNVPAAGRLPLYISGPGIEPRSADALISNIDISPTLVDLAGTSMPWADGLSFEPLLRGAPGGRDSMLEDHPVGGLDGRGGKTGPWWGIRTPEWHLIEWRGTKLYNLLEDPWEQHNLSIERPGTVDSLRAMRVQLSPYSPTPTPTPTPSPTPTSTPEPTPSSTP